MPFRFSLPLCLRLLLLSKELLYRLLFLVFIQQIGNILLAVPHHKRIILVTVSRLHTVNRRTLLCRTQGKPCILCFFWVKFCRLLLQLGILAQGIV